MCYLIFMKTFFAKWDNNLLKNLYGLDIFSKRYRDINHLTATVFFGNFDQSPYIYRFFYTLCIFLVLVYILLHTKYFTKLVLYTLHAVFADCRS